MTPLVVFPDAALLVIEYLRAELVEVPVGTRIPNPRPPRFVTVQRGGGTRRTVVSDDPILLIESWNTDSGAAHDVAQHCRALLFALEGTVLDDTPIYRVNEIAGPQELPDDTSNQPRYVFTTQIHLRGAVHTGS